MATLDGSPVKSGTGSQTQSTITYITGAADAAQSTLTPTSASITADGSSTQTLTVTAKDSFGNNLTTGGSTVTITKLSGTGTIGTVTDNSNGTYTAIVTSPTATGSGVFVATLDGAPVKSGTGSQTQSTITYTAGAADAAQSTLTPTSASITADGSSTQTLTVTAKDSFGNNLTTGGSTVVITKLSGTGTIGTVTDNSNGTYTATVTSPTATGSGVFVATLDGSPVKSGTGSQTQTTIIYITGAADAAQSTLTPTSAGITADGSSTQTLTVTAKDSFGNNLTTGGSTITITKLSGTGTIGTVTDNSNGTYTATVTSPTATGCVVFVDTLDGAPFMSGTGSQTQSTITYTAGTADAAQSTLTPTSASITADGSSTQILTVTAKDSFDNNLTTGSSTVTITKLSGTGTIGSVTDNSNGTYTATITSPTATGSGVFVATLDGALVKSGTGSQTQTTIIYITGAADAAQSTLTPTSAGITADGSSTQVLTVTARDSFGNNLTTGGSTVTITKLSGTGSIGSVTDNADDTYTATVTSPTATGSGVFVATLDGNPVKSGTASQTEATITYTPGAADAVQSTLTPTSASITADGTSTQVLTVTARDSFGNNLTTGGSTVTITKLSGTGAIGTVTDNSNGTYTATVTSLTATGSGVFVATLDENPVKSGTGNQTQATITYTPGAADAAQSTLTPTSAGITADGGSTQVLTVTAKDAYGNTLTSGGLTVTITKSSGTGSIGSVTDNADGTYTATVTSPTATGSGVFVATLDGAPVKSGIGSQTEAIVTYTAGIAMKFIITGTGAQTAGTPDNLTIFASDTFGNTDMTYTGDKSLIFSGASSSTNPVTQPTVKDKDGNQVNFGTPTTITFINGVATVSEGNNGVMTLYKAEMANIVATEGSITTTGADRLTVTVSSSAMNKFAVSLTVPQTNGVAFTGTNTLTAEDAYGNTVSTYDASTNNVMITATPDDGMISGLGSGSDNILNQGDDFINGVATLTNKLIFTGTSGSHTFTATSATGGYTGTSESVQINAGLFTKLQLLVPGETAAPGSLFGKIGTPISQTAGTAFNITVNAVDANWNVINTVTDVVGITSSDANANLPANASLSGGTQTFSVTLNTAGSATVTASDITDTGKIPNTSPSINVIPGSLNNFLVEAAAGGDIPSQIVETTFSIKITARDAENNIVTGFTGTVDISSNGTLSLGGGTTIAFTAGVLPSHQVRISNTGNFTITATKTGGVKNGTSNIFQVSARTFVYVSPSGSDITGDGSSGNPFLTIQHGIDLVADNGTVNVAAGIAAESISVDKNITLTGEGTLPLQDIDLTDAIKLTLGSDIQVNGTLALNSGELSIGANTLILNGAITRTSGTLTGGASSNIIVSGASAGTTLPAVILNNLTINRATGIELEGDVIIGGTLSLINGRLTLNNNDLVLTSNNPIEGSFSASTMIVLGGTGSLIKNFTGTGSYLFPVGSITNTIAYSPVNLNITSGDFNNAQVSVNLADIKDPNAPGYPNYLNRYWTIGQTGITNLVYNIDFTYSDGDVTGTESLLRGAKYEGSWEYYSGVNTSSNTFSMSDLTSFGEFSAFGEDLTATASVDPSTLCSGGSFNLISNASGGVPPYSFFWTGPNDYSNNQQNPPQITDATLSNSGVYTVTVTDANSNTIAASATLTVNQTPDQPITYGTVICSGNNATISASGADNDDSYKWYDAPSGGNLLKTSADNTDSTYTTDILLTTTNYWVSIISSFSCESNRTIVTVTVEDNVTPSITCPADITVNADEGECFATGVDLGNPLTSDNCGVASVINNAPTQFNVGVTTIIWTVIDNAVNSATCEQTVTVTDNQNPIITCPADVTVNADEGECFATGVVLGNPTTSDNCGVATVTNDAPAQFSVGVTTVTWTVTDNTGNIATCEQTVTANDNQNPMITCPADITVNADEGECFATGVDLGNPLTSDNCSVVSVTNNAPAQFNVGVTTVTWTVTDNSGNSATCEQTVIVTDNQNPMITCPADITVNADEGECFATGVDLGNPLTSDNCGVALVTNDTPAQFSVGVTTVTWTVTDNAGNSATCEQTVTVTDNQNPMITCPANVTINSDEGECFATGVDLGNPLTSDNCGVASVTNDTPAQFSVGVTTVTWTVTDNAGNSATCEQTVTVTDNQNPMITCPANVTINSDEGECFATGVVLGNPTTSDNCGVASVTNNAPAQFNAGVTTFTWIVTDNSGNSATCEQTVTVNDDQNPVITCPADITVNADEGECYATGVLLGSPTTSDNCSVASVTNDAPAQFNVGVTTIIWTVTDNAGNSTTCEQTVTVNDNQNPMITCPADVTVNADGGECFATGVVLGNPTTSDNCGVASVTNNAPSQFPVGPTTVIWTVTDNAGNTATCQQLVSVIDNQNPSISCPANVTVNADEGECFATGVPLGNPTISDNCGVASVESNDHLSC
ncbi:MAG: HYR domain-containing protein [Bacteroidetes bacterium]|nr:HYR domain-containing protein [Bacteroidota bacterium]